MAIRYIPVNKNEIQLFRRNRAIKERSRQEITDKSLIALRRVHLALQKNDAAFTEAASEFSGFVKQQKHMQIMEVINYYIADIN